VDGTEVLSGRSREEHRGRTVHDFYPKDQAEAFDAQDREAIARGGLLEVPETPILTPSGLRWIRTKKVPIKDGRGEPRWLLGISEDITDRREAADRVRSLERELAAPAMARVLAQADAVAADREATVLLLGETGTGKGWLARRIHAASPRAERPFIEVNCASLPGALIESELFGHERGAFTGAHEQKRGLVEAAEGGTLFLDEIGELSPGAQAQLLTFLDARTFAG
jgi:PAS domain S-box-containing protein